MSNEPNQSEEVLRAAVEAAIRCLPNVQRRILQRDLEPGRGGLADSRLLAEELDLPERAICALRNKGRLAVGSAIRANGEAMSWYELMVCAGELPTLRELSQEEEFAEASYTELVAPTEQPEARAQVGGGRVVSRRMLCAVASSLTLFLCAPTALARSEVFQALPDATGSVGPLRMLLLFTLTAFLTTVAVGVPAVGRVLSREPANRLLGGTQ